MLVVVVAIPIAAIAFIAGAGNSSSELGKGEFGDQRDAPAAADAARAPSAAARSREEEIRQMVEAKAYRQQARGEEPLDVDAESSGSTEQRAAPPLDADPGLRRGGPPARRRAQRAPRAPGQGAARRRGGDRAPAARARGSRPVALGDIESMAEQATREDRRAGRAAGPPGHLLQPADRGRRRRRRLDLDRPGDLQHGGLRGRRVGADLRRGAGRRGRPRHGAAAFQTHYHPGSRGGVSATRSSRATTSTTRTRTARSPATRTERVGGYTDRQARGRDRLDGASGPGSARCAGTPSAGHRAGLVQLAADAAGHRRARQLRPSPPRPGGDLPRRLGHADLQGRRRRVRGRLEDGGADDRRGALSPHDSATPTRTLDPRSTTASAAKHAGAAAVSQGFDAAAGSATPESETRGLPGLVDQNDDEVTALRRSASRPVVSTSIRATSTAGCTSQRQPGARRLERSMRPPAPRPGAPRTASKAIAKFAWQIHLGSTLLADRTTRSPRPTGPGSRRACTARGTWAFKRAHVRRRRGAAGSPGSSPRSRRRRTTSRCSRALAELG